MRKTIPLLLLAIVWLPKTYAQKIIAKESKVEFKIGNMGLGSVSGTISGMKGTVKFDRKSLNSSMFDVSISPSTIDTDSEKRDEHLKNEDFFNVANHLTITFTSYSIEREEDTYVTKGKLTILNTSKDIEIPFTVKEEGTKITFEGKIEVNRFDYGLAAESYKSTFMVGEVAEVKIICVIQE